jgi:glycine dehydrogenase subunit 2
MSAINQSGWRPAMNASSDFGAAAPTSDRQSRADARRTADLRDRIDGRAPASISPMPMWRRTSDLPPSLLDAYCADRPSRPERRQETVRHYTRLSRQNYAIDLGLFPLGSCTMKHNPRLNEKVARMPGFADRPPAPAD